MIDSITRQPVKVAKGLTNRNAPRALMQFFTPENYFAVWEAPLRTRRADLIGGCDGLIPDNPPSDAIEVRRTRAYQGDHDHTVANPATGEKPGERRAGPARFRRTPCPARHECRSRSPGRRTSQ